MSGQARPWWASDGPVDGGIAPDEDPVERIRAARRGESDGTAQDTGGPWLDAVADTMSRLAEATAQAADPAERGTARTGAPDPSEPGTARTGAPDPGGAGPGGPAGGPGGEPEGHTPDICGVCPVCVGFRALAESRPELMGHLAEAARHVALAARSLRERPDAATSRERRGGQPLEHIDLE